MNYRDEEAPRGVVALITRRFHPSLSDDEIRGVFLTSVETEILRNPVGVSSTVGVLSTFSKPLTMDF
ncbi:hypothetical protein ES702_00106 [subsurface metagenome]